MSTGSWVEVKQRNAGRCQSQTCNGRARFSSYNIYIYLSAYARQPARGPTMLAHFVAMLAYVGLCWPMLAYVSLCWPILWAMWAQLGAMLAQLGAMLIHVESKDPKNRHSKKNTVKRRIFWWSAAYLGAMLAHLGAMLAYLEGNVGPSWGYVDPSWGYVGPSWLPHLEGMLADLEAYGPFWPILSHKIRTIGKNGKSTKHCKTRYILMVPRSRRQGVQPLSPTERRELPYGNATASTGPGGPLAGI